MEIERKFLLKTIPDNLEQYVSHRIEQGYLCVDPVVRIRKEENDYILTYKGEGMMARQESNLPLKEASYNQLKSKVTGNIISKTRYMIPLENPEFKQGFPQPPSGYTLTVEIDVFDPPFAPLVMAEVEFGSQEAAVAFIPPEWFGEEVTYVKQFHNSYMAYSDPMSWQVEIANR
ncbi:MAG: CYTH domain-containing protein [Lachnospiraceae bacterium]|nr:CYTH domain-containing protein [Lachnospiraceae bacterium]